MIKGDIILKARKEQSLLRFHPWVFSGAIGGQVNFQEGDFVRVVAASGQILGYGHFTPNTSIAVRLTHFGNEEPSENWIRERLQSAYDLREQIGLADNPNTNTYRLVHAEGDLLPGLIIDHYDGVFVIQAHSSGMYQLRHKISEALQEIYGNRCKAVFDKSAETLAKSKLVAENGYLFGSSPETHQAKENGLEFRIDWEGGQKTGFFIDQRESRKLLGEMSKGKSVLNTFSYTGGFSLYALQSGATKVHSLDSSARALEIANENAALNGYSDRHDIIQADAVQYLKNLGEEYDIIVLDPPAFAKHLSARHQAVQGYKRINSLAMRQMKPGGLLFTFSCSQAVDKQLFNSTIVAAAIEAGRKVRILHQLHQPADHPVSAFHPEGEYLKGLVVRVD
ncbi:MAG: methyltransferase [Cryomorphaceae bacterium]|nr:methyltransferase [Cryomorphaceae bacterium]